MRSWYGVGTLCALRYKGGRTDGNFLIGRVQKIKN